MKRPWKKIKRNRDPIPLLDKNGVVYGHLDPENEHQFTPVPGYTETPEKAAMRLLTTRVWFNNNFQAACALMKEKPGLSYGEAASAIACANRDIEANVKAHVEKRPELVAILKTFDPDQVMEYSNKCKALIAQGVPELEARRRVLLKTDDTRTVFAPTVPLRSR